MRGRPIYADAIQGVNQEIDGAIKELEDERKIEVADAIVDSFGGDISHVRTYGPWRAAALAWEVKFRRLREITIGDRQPRCEHCGRPTSGLGS